MRQTLPPLPSLSPAPVSPCDVEEREVMRALSVIVGIANGLTGAEAAELLTACGEVLAHHRELARRRI